VIIDGNSGPITSVKVLPGTTTVTWASVSGGVYEVLYKDNMASSTWNVLSTGITATSSSTSWVDPQTLAHRFYRVSQIR